MGSVVAQWYKSVTVDVKFIFSLLCSGVKARDFVLSGATQRREKNQKISGKWASHAVCGRQCGADIFFLNITNYCIFFR